MADDSAVPDWRIYERFVAALQSEAASDDVTVIPNAKIRGCITGRVRQVDVLLEARLGDDVKRRIIVDAKRTRRKLDLLAVEAFKGLMEECRAHRGVLVSPTGFTASAHRRAQDHITLSLVELHDLDDIDLFAWDCCVGRCLDSRNSRERGWVLYDEPYGFAIGPSPASLLALGKCDECADFHVWCWDCGEKFALRGNTAESKCACERFWLTSIEDDGEDELGNRLEAVYLLLVPLARPIPIIMGRRPLR